MSPDQGVLAVQPSPAEAEAVPLVAGGSTEVIGVVIGVLLGLTLITVMVSYHTAYCNNSTVCIHCHTAAEQTCLTMEKTIFE